MYSSMAFTPLGGSISGRSQTSYCGQKSERLPTVDIYDLFHHWPFGIPFVGLCVIGPKSGENLAIISFRVSHFLKSVNLWDWGDGGSTCFFSVSIGFLVASVSVCIGVGITTPWGSVAAWNLQKSFSVVSVWLWGARVAHSKSFRLSIAPKMPSHIVYSGGPRKFSWEFEICNHSKVCANADISLALIYQKQQLFQRDAAGISQQRGELLWFFILCDLQAWLDGINHLNL